MVKANDDEENGVELFGFDKKDEDELQQDEMDAISDLQTQRFSARSNLESARSSKGFMSERENSESDGVDRQVPHETKQVQNIEIDEGDDVIAS